jgi:hypothetical protein
MYKVAWPQRPAMKLSRSGAIPNAKVSAAAAAAAKNASDFQK